MGYFIDGTFQRRDISKTGFTERHFTDGHFIDGTFQRGKISISKTENVYIIIL